VLAPNSSLRALITPAGRGRGSPRERGIANPAQRAEQSDWSEQSERSGLPRHVALRRAQRLKRVFEIEIEACVRCAALLKIVASIEDPGVIARMLAHRDRVSDSSQDDPVLHAARGMRRARFSAVPAQVLRARQGMRRAPGARGGRSRISRG
jgi:hypothetical protein